MSDLEHKAVIVSSTDTSNSYIVPAAMSQLLMPASFTLGKQQNTVNGSYNREFINAINMIMFMNINNRW